MTVVGSRWGYSRSDGSCTASRLYVDNPPPLPWVGFAQNTFMVVPLLQPSRRIRPLVA
jgi:hypothetical protein